LRTTSASWKLQKTVKRLIREGKLPATELGNKWGLERDRLQVFANTYDGSRGRATAKEYTVLYELAVHAPGC